MTSFITNEKYKKYVQIENPSLNEIVINVNLTDVEKSFKIQEIIEKYKDKLNGISRN